MRIGLVSCAAQKLPYTKMAAELYTSPLFVKASRYASRTYDTWYILSAKYGFIDPDEIIDPYDVTLNTMSRTERQAWVQKVFEQIALRDLVRSGNTFYFHAGKRYREGLVELLRQHGASVEVPLADLGIGQQLAWYKAWEQNDASATISLRARQPGLFEGDDTRWPSA